MGPLDELREELRAEPITAAGEERVDAVRNFEARRIVEAFEAELRRWAEELRTSEEQLLDYARRYVRRLYEERGFSPDAVARAVESVRVVEARQDGELYYRIEHTPLVIIGTVTVR